MVEITRKYNEEFLGDKEKGKYSRIKFKKKIQEEQEGCGRF